MPLYKHTAHFDAPLKGLRILPELPPEPPKPTFSEEQLRQAVEEARARATQIAQSQLAPQIQQARQQALTLQNGVLTKLNGQFDSVLKEVYARMPELMMALVRRVLIDVEMTPEILKGIVINTLSEISSESEKMEVRLNPADLQLLQNNDNQLENRFPQLTFKADPTLSSGDCMMNSRFGLVDARVQTKLQKIFDDLQAKE